MQTNQSINWQGQVLGHYRFLRPLGHSNAGESWFAEDTRFNRQVVVRLLPPVPASEQVYLQTFVIHARMLANLEHPNILPIYDSGDHMLDSKEVVTYLVMPHIGGGSLQERLQERSEPLQTPDILLYLRQAAQALDYAHSRQMIHGNLKPTNMLLQQGQVLLADFGLTRLLTDTVYQNRTYTVGIGSAEYMAPEQGQGRPQFASDRYSLAVVAYQLFTGQVPFSGGTPYDILLMHMREQPTPPQQMAQLPAAVNDVLLQGLAKQPENRLPTCLAFVEALESAWQVQPRVGTSPTATHVQQSQPLSTMPIQEQDDDDGERTVLAPWSRRIRALTTPVLLPLVDTPPPNAQPAQSPAAYAYTSLPSVTEEPTAISSSPQTTPMPGANQYSPPIMNSFTANGYQGGETGNSQEQYISTLVPQNMQSPMQSTPSSPGYAPAPSDPQVPHVDQPESKASRVSRRNLLIGGGLGTAALVGASVAGFIYLHPNSTPASPTPTSKPVIGPTKLQDGVPVVSLTGHTAPVWTAVWSPDGRYLATGGEDHSVMVWDIDTMLQKKQSGVQTLSKPMRSWKYDKNIYNNRICWSPDGHKLLVSLGQSKIYLLDVFGKEDATPTYIFDQNKVLNQQSFDLSEYSYIDWSRKGDFIAAATAFQKDIWIWQDQKLTEPLKKITLAPPPNDSQANLITPGLIGWSIDGSKLATLTNNSAAVVWEATTGNEVFRADLPERTTDKSVFINREALAWSPIDPNVLMVTDIDIATILDIRKGQQPLLQLGINDPYPLTPPPDDGKSTFKWIPHVNGATWAPNGKYIAGTYGRSTNIYVWETDPQAKSTLERNLRMQKLMFGSGGHSETIIDIAWSPNGQYIASTSFDTTVIVWKVDGA
jgi:serine/threonine protein kinase